MGGGVGGMGNGAPGAKDTFCPRKTAPFWDQQWLESGKFFGKLFVSFPTLPDACLKVVSASHFAKSFVMTSGEGYGDPDQ